MKQRVHPQLQLIQLLFDVFHIVSVFRLKKIQKMNSEDDGEGDSEENTTGEQP